MLRYISKGDLKREVKDLQVWGGNDTGKFSVKSTCRCLANHVTGSPSDIFKQLWQAKALPNVLTIDWKILLDGMPTRTSLIRKGVLLSSISCVHCSESKESSQHLFIECTIA